MSGIDGQMEGTNQIEEDSCKKVTSKGLMKMIQLQDYRCAITGIKLTPETATVDHIVSVKKGGKNSIDNVQIVHQEANRMKGSLSMDELYTWCEMILRSKHQQAGVGQKSC